MSADLHQGCLVVRCLGCELDLRDAEREGQRGERWVTASGLADGANCVEDGQRLEPETERVKWQIVKRLFAGYRWPIWIILSANLVERLACLQSEEHALDRRTLKSTSFDTPVHFGYPPTPTMT
jgi:hypothetical protein